jgi:hypothetical protein
MVPNGYELGIINLDNHSHSIFHPFTKKIMTALNIATDIPSQIDTLEKLMVWGSRCLTNLNSNVAATEGENYVQRATSAGVFYIAAVDKTRHIGRQSIELSADNLIGASKTWATALEISTKPLTAVMKSN